MKKNIMLLIGYLNNGGAERSIVNLANKLNEKHNVILVVVKRHQDYECDVPIIEVRELGLKKKRRDGIRKLRKLKKEYNIDTTISYTTVFNFYNVMSRYKDRVIISVRNHLSTKKEGFWPTIIHKLSIRLCDKIVCCSKSVMNDQINNYHASKNKTLVITNFCNLDFINNEINKDYTSKDAKLIKNDFIVTVARLVPHKGHEHIIKAMSLVVKEKPKVKLLIFSRGLLKEKLEELVKDYKLEKNVVFMGFHPNPYQILKKAKCFILASDYEGFPNAVIEAMSCGTPVIATDVPGGTKEILMDKVTSLGNVTKLTKTDYGILIPGFMEEHGIKKITKNERILRDAILTILKNRDIYNHYHEKSLERIKEYDSDKVIADWLDII